MLKHVDETTWMKPSNTESQKEKQIKTKIGRIKNLKTKQRGESTK